ncbi:uncharacterized protein LOC144031796 [Festucalex cinctus]
MTYEEMKLRQGRGGCERQEQGERKRIEREEILPPASLLILHSARRWLASRPRSRQACDSINSVIPNFCACGTSSGESFQLVNNLSVSSPPEPEGDHKRLDGERVECGGDKSSPSMAFSHSLIIFYIFNAAVTPPVLPVAVPSSNLRVAQIAPLPALQLTATPDYPVAAGQKVSLHCSAPNQTAAYDNWYWQRQEKETWERAGEGANLTLSEPQQSGLYRCLAERGLSKRVSPNHAVFIISFHATEYVGITALALSLLALIMNIAVMFWLGWQKLRDKATPANTGANGFSRPGKEPKGGLPQAENDGHVYMNYSSSNLSYTDLDLQTAAADSTYSVLP